MTRLSTAVLLALLVAAAAPAARQEPTLRAGTHTVSVYASVVDGAGRLVTGLSKDDFLVLDDGRPQELTVFTGDIQPITIVVMLDRSGSVTQQYEQVRAAAEQFVNSLGEGDRARIGSFSTAIRLDPYTFTSDRDTLIRILHEDLLGAGPTPLWNAAAVAMTALRPEAGRRVVLMFTDGYDNPMTSGVHLSTRDIRERARNEETMLYGIGLAIACAPSEDAGPRAWSARPGLPFFQGRGGGRGGGTGRGAPIPRLPGRIGGGVPRLPLPLPPPTGPRLPGIDPPPRNPFGGPAGPKDGEQPCKTTEPDPGLREVALDSGGGYFELQAAEELGQTFARVADELHRQYLLGFAPAALDGRTHNLEVRVRGADMTVRARRSYVAAAR
jgi:VWFA-related protein